MPNIVGIEHKVLDHGFVKVVDIMGKEFTDVVEAARLSYGQGTRKISEDRAVMRYLMRQHHSSPFEMMELKLYCRMPIFIARQWIRHRTANVNEYSLRYSEVQDIFYIPDVQQICEQSKKNKQGRDFPISLGLAKNMREAIIQHTQNGFNLYNMFLNNFDASERKDYYMHSVMSQVLEDESFREGMARELARIVLPLNTYTEWYWKNDLSNLIKFLSLRADPHAQYEIREYAYAIEEIVKAWVPEIYEAYVDYIKESVTLSGPEIVMLRKLFHSNSAAAEFMREQLIRFRQDDAVKHRLSQREADSLYNIFGF